MAEPWRMYLDALRLDRAEATAQAWARDELVRERAHEAYRATADALTSSGWDEEDALTLTRGFGLDVKAWVEAGSAAPEDLSGRLEERWRAWQANRGPSVERRPEQG